MKSNEVPKKLKVNNNINNIFSEKLCNNGEKKIVKTEFTKTNSKGKRKDKNSTEKENNKLIKTKLPIEKIKYIIKSLVGNNVVCEKNNGFFKFICKAKIGKDDLIFILEIISKNYDTFVLKGTLEKGETKTYKKILKKFKEKLN